LLHPGPLVADGAIDVAVEAGASTALDLAAAADEPVHGFLRAAWFDAAAGDRPLATLTARRAASGEPVAAIPLVARRLGPLSLGEVPGSYWPYRSFPVARDAGTDELAALLAAPAAGATLGRAWRLGPVYEDDPTLPRLLAAARRAGWTMLSRRLGTAFMVDLAGLTASGPWPSSKTLRKNRWLERRLAEDGELDFVSVGADRWNDETFDLLAGIERDSWVGRTTGDTKFLDPAGRRLWARAAADPDIAARLHASILRVGGVAAAFTFGLRSGDTLHFIANSYSDRFREGSPGRILLYRDLRQAAADGLRTIGWGAGDPGYKTEMGARPGPAILDLLFVRGRFVAALARPLWRRGHG
jgi:CelD/BcsL family acetyltransferase involved in cellulose biosynthesis